MADWDVPQVGPELGHRLEHGPFGVDPAKDAPVPEVVTVLPRLFPGAGVGGRLLGGGATQGLGSAVDGGDLGRLGHVRGRQLLFEPRFRASGCPQLLQGTLGEPRAEPPLTPRARAGETVRGAGPSVDAASRDPGTPGRFGCRQAGTWWTPESNFEEIITHIVHVDLRRLEPGIDEDPSRRTSSEPSLGPQSPAASSGHRRPGSLPGRARRGPASSAYA